MVRRSSMIFPVVLLALGLSVGVASAADPGVGVDIAVTEAVSFTKRVATIDDCVFDSATISWGDGTSTPVNSIPVPPRA